MASHCLQKEVLLPSAGMLRSANVTKKILLSIRRSLIFPWKSFSFQEGEDDFKLFSVIEQSKARAVLLLELMGRVATCDSVTCFLGVSVYSKAGEVLLLKECVM